MSTIYVVDVLGVKNDSEIEQKAFETISGPEILSLTDDKQIVNRLRANMKMVYKHIRAVRVAKVTRTQRTKRTGRVSEVVTRDRAEVIRDFTARERAAWLSHDNTED